jgi:hypothetical protein
LRSIASILTATGAIVGIASLSSCQALIKKYLGPNTTKYAWRIIALVIALLNLKNLPGFWHIRVLRGIM